MSTFSGFYLFSDNEKDEVNNTSMIKFQLDTEHPPLKKQNAEDALSNF